MISNYKLAKQVVVKAREEVIMELVRCGSAGGVGRANSYAPQLVALTNALDILESLDPEVVPSNPVQMTDEQLNTAVKKANKAA